MLRLVAMRHATAGRLHGVPDRERRLTPEGRQEAALMGQALVRLGWAPERLTSSDAVRTKETWRAMAPHLGEVALRWEPDLYAADVDTACRVLGEEWDPVASVLALGHNPGLEELVQWLSGVRVTLLPATAALLTHPGGAWGPAIADRAGWRLHDVVRPAMLNTSGGPRGSS